MDERRVEERKLWEQENDPAQGRIAELEKENEKSKDKAADKEKKGED